MTPTLIAGNSRAVLARDVGGMLLPVLLPWAARLEQPDTMAVMQVRMLRTHGLTNAWKPL